MSTKDSKMNQKDIKGKESLISSNRILLLNKISHKPLIIELLYSFALKRPYILLDFINKDKYLKIAMNKVFDEHILERDNDLSTELKQNINIYLKYKKILDKIINITKNISVKYKGIYKMLQKPVEKINITNIFSDSKVDKYLKNENEFYTILNEKSHLFKNEEFFDLLNNFKNYKISSFLLELKNQGKIALFLEAIYLVNKDIFEKYFQYNIDFHKFPNFTKNYRKFCKAEVEKQILEEGIKENVKYKEISIINNAISQLKKDANMNLKSFIFDYLQSLEIISLYNINYENNLDSEYLKYITKLNIKQNIRLLCIIDRYNYSQFIDIITYPNIISLHFSLFSYENFSDRFMYYNLPINNIFNIIMNYIVAIKYNSNIKTISFGEEFLLNKNQFICYNDLYYQSFISYIIDQYMENEANKSEDILSNINLDDIILKEDNLDNIYERYKILYGLNKMFINLKNKKILLIKYSDILLYEQNNINVSNNNYKKILIDFNNEPKEEVNQTIKNINKFITNNKDRFINVEMLSFYNFTLTNNEEDLINNIKNNNNISNNTFDGLPNLKEFFINNNNSNKIAVNEKINIKFKHFNYLYLGYDSNNNIIFYRNGSNKIKSLDILDLLNIINKNITKLFLVYENISIIINKLNSELKIINNSNNNEGDFYFYPLKNLSDFIYNYKYYKNLIIEGFDFIFTELKNNNAEKIYINYNLNKENRKKNYEYKYKSKNEIDKYKINDDINLKSNFPILEEIFIGNINEDKKFYRTLSIINADIKINILSSVKVKLNKKCKNLNIEYQKNFNDDDNKINIHENGEEEEEDNYEEENNFDYDDNYEDDIIVNKIKPKNKKFKERKEDDETLVCIRRKLNYYHQFYDYYVYFEESTLKESIKYLKRKKIIYFKSDIIVELMHFVFIQSALSFLFPSKTKFNCSLISKGFDDKLIEKFKIMNNALLIIKEHGLISCVYQKNPKFTCLNHFILKLHELWRDSDYYCIIKKKDMIVEDKNIYVVEQKEFSNEFDFILDVERYETNNDSMVELFKIS